MHAPPDLDEVDAHVERNQTRQFQQLSQKKKLTQKTAVTFNLRKKIRNACTGQSAIFFTQVDNVYFSH